MIEIEKKDYKELKKVIPDIDKLLKEENLDELLDQVDDLIVFNLGKNSNTIFD